MRILTAIAFIRIAGIDFSVGHDIQSLSLESIEKCEEACIYNLKCKGFVFNYSHNKCYIKDNLNGIRQNNENELAGFKIKENI